VTTSLPGYGGTAERRPAGDPSIAYLAAVVESVVRQAGEPVHLVGHSFGGLVSLAVALRKRVPLASIAMLEPPGIELLLERGEDEHYRAFGRMTEAYVAAFNGGERHAIAAMIDFYGGAGTFASWPSNCKRNARSRRGQNPAASRLVLRRLCHRRRDFADRRRRVSVIFPESRFSPRIKSGAGFFRIMLRRD
jgi:pimeloyl-ACP methyl ester carboxylesterase